MSGTVTRPELAANRGEANESTSQNLHGLTTPPFVEKETAGDATSSNIMTLSKESSTLDGDSAVLRHGNKNDNNKIAGPLPYFLKDKRVAVTGANLGLALANELTEAGAKLIAIVRSSSDELEALKPAELIQGIDVRNDEQCAGIAGQIKGGPIDIVSNLTNTDPGG